jgi:hypothetical protein
MKVRFRHVFELREPPGGGLQGLRSRLEENRRQGALRARARWLGATGVVAAATVVVVARLDLIWVQAAGPPPGRGDMVAALVAPPVECAQPEPVSVPHRARGATAVQRVVLPDDDVVFYLIGTESP